MDPLIPYWINVNGTVSQLHQSQLASTVLNEITIYPTQADAQSKTNGITGTSPLQQAGNTVTGALGSTADLIQRLTQASTWIRVAEVVLGLLFLAVGLAKLTNAIPLATKAAAVLA